MRMRAFIRDLALKQCGGEPLPLDETFDRYAQDLFPDLRLIRSMGLTEEVKPQRQIGADCTLVPKEVPSYFRWMDEGANWQKLAYRVRRQSAKITHLAPRMAACLRRRTGLQVSDRNPTDFLNSVNMADVKGVPRTRYMSWSRAYSACGRSYFSAFAAILAKRRAAAIKANGTLLRALASEVVAAGYSP